MHPQRYPHGPCAPATSAGVGAGVGTAGPPHAQTPEHGPWARGTPHACAPPWASPGPSDMDPSFETSAHRPVTVSGCPQGEPTGPARIASLRMGTVSVNNVSASLWTVSLCISVCPHGKCPRTVPHRPQCHWSKQPWSRPETDRGGRGSSPVGAEAVEIDSRQCRQQWTGLASTGDKQVLEALL